MGYGPQGQKVGHNWRGLAHGEHIAPAAPTPRLSSQSHPHPPPSHTYTQIKTYVSFFQPLHDIS